jgi:hypothetical protein
MEWRAAMESLSAFDYKRAALATIAYEKSTQHLIAEAASSNLNP